MDGRREEERWKKDKETHKRRWHRLIKKKTSCRMIHVAWLLVHWLFRSKSRVTLRRLLAFFLVLFLAFCSVSTPNTTTQEHTFPHSHSHSTTTFTNDSWTSPHHHHRSKQRLRRKCRQHLPREQRSQRHLLCPRGTEPRRTPKGSRHPEADRRLFQRHREGLGRRQCRSCRYQQAWCQPHQDPGGCQAVARRVYSIQGIDRFLERVINACAWPRLFFFDFRSLINAFDHLCNVLRLFVSLLSDRTSSQSPSSSTMLDLSATSAKPQRSSPGRRQGHTSTSTSSPSSASGNFPVLAITEIMSMSGCRWNTLGSTDTLTLHQ